MSITIASIVRAISFCGFASEAKSNFDRSLP
jgi:hypothetical protein